MSNSEIGFSPTLMERAAFGDFFLHVKSLGAALDSETFSDNGLDHGILENPPKISTEGT
jgi:hypothetical protein